MEINSILSDRPAAAAARDRGIKRKQLWKKTPIRSLQYQQKRERAEERRDRAMWLCVDGSN
jgi:hypothetical protein